MAYLIIKSAGDDFSFTTMFVSGTVGHSYAYAEKMAHDVTKAMKKATLQNKIIEGFLDVAHSEYLHDVDSDDASAKYTRAIVKKKLLEILNEAEK